jgi:hypothetical protein
MNSGGGDRWGRWRKKVGQIELLWKEEEDMVAIGGDRTLLPARNRHKITLSILHPHELAQSPPFVLMNVLSLHCLGI